MTARYASAAGLQVLSAVVRHFTRGMAPVSMVCKAKTPAHAWGLSSSEVILSMWRRGTSALDRFSVTLAMSSGDTPSHLVAAPSPADTLLAQEYMEFRSGDMVTGLLDKAQFGSYGLVHSVQVTFDEPLGQMSDVKAVLQGWNNCWHGHSIRC